MGKLIINKDVLLSSLTFEEKVSLVTGSGSWHTKEIKDKLPSVMMTDGPHGIRKEVKEGGLGANNKSVLATCFPTAAGLASTWNTDLISECGNAIAKEAKAHRIGIVLGCGTNIKRSPLNGRNFEYFSEDPYLAGKMATTYINAVQENGVGTSLKHFACNNQETRRQVSNSQIDSRALREIYLRPFEMAVKNAQPATIMGSYNILNGTHACESKELLTNILRNEWGFEGAVISDWGACVDLTKAINSGLDLEMPDSNGFHKINKNIDMAALNRAVTNVINLAQKYSPETSIPASKEEIDKILEENDFLAEKIECEAAVLLKNKGNLPIDTEFKKVIIIGEMAENMRFQGGGSSHINASRKPNAVKVFRDNGFEVTYAKGYCCDNEKPDKELEKEAIAILKANANNVPVLFFGGLPDFAEGEGYDRKTLSIPQNQIELIEKLSEVTRNIIFIGFGGSAFEMPFINRVSAILNMYLGGQAVDRAVYSLVTGKENPSGKLAESFPFKLEDTHCYKWFGQESDDIEYRESIFVGYRYYDKYHRNVMYPFGHGLSYTCFNYSNPSYDATTNTVSLTLTNTGKFDGKEIVQVYVKNPKANYLRAFKELKGFAKVELKQGEAKTVNIKLDDNAFSIYDENKRMFCAIPGNYILEIGASSRDTRLEIPYTLEGKEYTRNDLEKLSEYFNQEGCDFDISKQQFMILYGRPLSNLDGKKPGDFTVYDSLNKLAEYSSFARLFKAIAKNEVYKAFKGKPKNDPEVMMVIQGMQENTIDSVFSMAAGMMPYKLAEAIVSFANNDAKNGWKNLLKK
ncbi:MAG: glycoside hydrolase family 3 C-terminal domain-containing protein [Lachnospiraceae bacterium]|nr:glycoside hydrolase family 3 C-terminal domain-containing protein [Lachnospiraceae bacterium]